MSTSDSTECDSSGHCINNKETQSVISVDSLPEIVNSEEINILSLSSIDKEVNTLYENGSIIDLEDNTDEISEPDISIASGEIHFRNESQSQTITSDVSDISLETENKDKVDGNEAKHLVDLPLSVEECHSNILVDTDSDIHFENVEIVLNQSIDQSLDLIPSHKTQSEKLSNIHPPNGISESLFSHPAYKTVIQELAHFKEQISVLQSEVSRLECDNQRLEADHSHDIYVVQLETLEKTISQQHRELHRVNEQSRQQAELAAKNFAQMRQDLEGKLERLTKQYETANKEKESMVMRYAISEKEVIDQKKERETLDRKLKEASKEKEILMSKLKILTSEKARICQMLDTKHYELSAAVKENEKLKEDLNSREIKIKWAQNKLRTEIDAHKETQCKLDKIITKLQEAQEKNDQVRRDCQDTIRNFQESQENKAYTLDQQLKEQQAKLIMERHERNDKEETHRQLQQEVDNLKRKHQLIIDENNLLSVKVQSLEKERLEYEQNLSKLKRLTDKQKQDVVDLQAQLAEMESVRIQMQHEQERLTASQGEVERLRFSNADLQQDMTICREKEAELLEFTQKLTEKNVRLQSEFSATEAKAVQLEYEQGPLQRRQTELEGEVSSLRQQLQQERQQRQDESQLLARHLAERTQRADTLAQQLEDEQGENQLLRKKQVTTVRELTRELQQCRRRLEQYEMLSSNNSLGQGSRASSCTSLNAISSEPNVPQSNEKPSGGQSSPRTSISSQRCRSSSSLDYLYRAGKWIQRFPWQTFPLPFPLSNKGERRNSQPSPPLEPDRQMLIERIVKLQRASARKTEKLEFMEEHNRQLVGELQKKTRIVQSYVMREQSGALSSDSMDQNKAELLRHGGIMASLYGSKAVDNSMTLELSLEINKKLQAVLEDTLLKNITLKENIDTLGTEIARLTMPRSNPPRS